MKPPFAIPSFLKSRCQLANMFYILHWFLFFKSLYKAQVSLSWSSYTTKVYHDWRCKSMSRQTLKPPISIAKAMSRLPIELGFLFRMYGCRCHSRNCRLLRIMEKFSQGVILSRVLPFAFMFVAFFYSLPPWNSPIKFPGYCIYFPTSVYSGNDLLAFNFKRTGLYEFEI